MAENKKMSPEEMIKLAEDKGIELTDEQLESISGGGSWSEFIDSICPDCGNYLIDTHMVDEAGNEIYYCSVCDAEYI